MKLKSLALLMITTVASAAYAMPQTPALSKVDLAGYYSSQHPQTTKALALGNSYPSTDITIVNGSNNIIQPFVPNSPVYDTTASGDNDHIRHNTMVGPTRVSIQDPYNNVFFDQVVCRLAVVSVSGVVGSYHVNVDSEYCNRP